MGAGGVTCSNGCHRLLLIMKRYGAFDSCMGAMTGDERGGGTHQQMVNCRDSPAMPCQGSVNTNQGQICAGGDFVIGWRCCNGRREECLGGSLCFTYFWPLHSTCYATFTQSKVGSGVIKPYSFKPLQQLGQFGHPQPMWCSMLCMSLLSIFHSFWYSGERAEPLSVFYYCL